jgi:hypothetical protein
MGSAVLCAKCGASTSLPDDLRVPTFSCSACHETLSTAEHVGRSAVAVDALMGWMGEAINKPFDADAARAAPKVPHGHGLTKSMPCQKCGAALAVPLDLGVHQVRCDACARTWPVAAYISDVERMNLDMARQVAENAAFAERVANGIRCAQCGGHNDVPDDDSVQIVCVHCGAAVLLGADGHEEAVARRRLKHGVFAVRDELIARQEAKQRRERWIALAVVGVVVLGAAGVAGVGAVVAAIGAVLR